MAYTDREDLNYLGQLFLIGANQTPFLNMMGGLSGGKRTTSFNFPLTQTSSLRTADQSTAVKSEATSITDVTAITYARAQTYNTCQIMKYPYEVSFAKASATGEISGIAIAGQAQPVTNELAYQKTLALKQMAIDLEFSFLQGSYVAQNLASTVAKTRGLIEACTVNTVDASAAGLSKALIDALLLEMATNGAEWGNMVMFCGGFQKQRVTDIYGYAPAAMNIGGIAVDRLIADFCQMGVVFDPLMPAGTILIADMSACAPVFCPYEGQIIADTETAVTTAKKGGFLYAQVGLDYGPAVYHGTLTNLATS